MAFFYYKGIKLKLHSQVYEPAEDTFLLAENLKIREGDIALDMGTGTGIIALLMAKKAKFVLGVDINPIAVELAKENAKINEIKNVEFRVSDLFENVEGKFDIITFNSPYLPGEAEELKEPIDLALIGGMRGKEVLDRFISQVKDYLKPNGIVQIVQSSITGVEDTIEKLTKLGFKVEITAKERYFFEEILVITAKLNESS
ncbi:HemK2/MTQ2 family protein methyltransferase [Thermococcus sp. SY098]|uniref:HemK2/MTQ2 family protein methyltransferase n=1 Tax=Thermococcus sp. SY098 TaxID=3111325 RepID=UPI002D783467|nr:HemK2/MTQ2 family protein methyltransferase [Thermococcus sp. SY098]WRS52075.1 HemK2/MTQ2 family protein methyltransferase [Thermococcus sp. SY098]